jgi:triacylglycerol lipase
MPTFNPNAQIFDKGNAQALLSLAQLAYADEATIRQSLDVDNQSLPFVFIESQIAGHDTECFMVSDEQAVFVAFRGTEQESRADWVTNLDNRLMDKFTGQVHQGFWEAMETVWVTIWDFIQREKAGIAKPLWFTGHSQGGALAMLAARQSVEMGVIPQGVYTFGQPKVGDLLFASNYEAMLPGKTYRVYNEGDSVVDNPPKLYHTGIGVKLTEDGLYYLEDSANLIETSDSIAAVLDSLFDLATDNMQAHSLAEYARRLA